MAAKAPRIGLTKRQAELLAYIETYSATEWVSPSFEEMKEALGLKSKSGVHRLIEALVERGYINRLPNRARALEVVKAPELKHYSTEALLLELRGRGIVVRARSVLSIMREAKRKASAAA